MVKWRATGDAAGFEWLTRAKWQGLRLESAGGHDAAFNGGLGDHEVLVLRQGPRRRDDFGRDDRPPPLRRGWNHLGGVYVFTN